MAKLSDVRVVATSALVSVSDVVLNLIVALFTGSTVMLSQALQGLSDLVTGGLLFVGVKRSRREADARFQFGYGREIFFWVLIASIIMFAGTGAMSLYFGYQQIVYPSPVEHIWLAFAMLGFGLITNGYAFSLSLKRLHQEGSEQGDHWWRYLVNSSLIETKATFAIDFLGTSAAVFGLLALGIYQITGLAQFDGVGSVLIGVTMMVAAVMLMRDIRDLIVGRGVDTKTLQMLQKEALAVKGVNAVLDLMTMYVGSSKLFVVMELHLQDDFTTDEIEKIVDAVKSRVHKKIPLVHHIQIEVETPDEEIVTSRKKHTS
jgi:cation diffusion facilitator family transporter